MAVGEEGEGSVYSFVNSCSHFDSPLTHRPITPAIPYQSKIFGRVYNYIYLYAHQGSASLGPVIHPASLDLPPHLPCKVTEGPLGTPPPPSTLIQQ